MVLVGARAVAASALLVALAVPANASLLEDLSGGAVAYQFDADNHHDAPDACADADVAWSLPVDGAVDGMLVPGEDSSDVFVVDVPPVLVGGRLTIGVREASGTPDLDVSGLVPGCVSDLFAPENQPFPPYQAPQPGGNQRQVSVANVNVPQHCDPTERVFELRGMNATPAPSSIFLAWTNGQQAFVPLASNTNGYAVYRTTSHLGFTLEGAWAVIDAGFNGTFIAWEGPCNAKDGGAVYGEPAVVYGDGLAFTPIRAGAHAVVVTFSGEAPATSAPMTCHMCIGGLEKIPERVSYLLSSTTAE